MKYMNISLEENFQSLYSVKMAPVILVSNREEDSMNTEPSLSGRQVIGIIYPPPDIRSKCN